MLTLAAAAAVGCSDDDTAPGDGGGKNFKLSVSDITVNSCKIGIAPKDAGMTYIAMVARKDELESFESDNALISSDLEDFKAEAEYSGMSLSDILYNNYIREGVETVDIEDLEPDYDYCLYAYGMTVEGVATTAVDRKMFSTKAVPQVPAEFTIDISDMTPTSCKVDVSVDPAGRAFFFNVISEEEYRYYGGDIRAFARHMKARMVDVYLSQGRTIEEIYEHMACRKGHDSDTFTNLRAGKKYYAFAVGVNEQFLANTATKVREFTTDEVPQSSNEFKIDITPTYDGIDGTITTTNDDQYIWAIQTKADVDLCYQNDLPEAENDEELMYLLVEQYKASGSMASLLHKGSSVVSYHYLEPESDYYLLVFGWDDAPTTELIKTPIRTTSGESDASKLEISFKIENIKHNGATVTLTPNCGVPYYYDKVPASRYDELLAEKGDMNQVVAELLEASLQEYIDYFGGDMSIEEAVSNTASLGEDTWTYNDMEPETAYRVFAISIDMKTGKPAYPKGFVSDEFTTSEHVVSKASLTFTPGKYYDGDALAALDPDKYGACKGMAMLTYTIEPNADAAHWYSNFYPGNSYDKLDDDTAIAFLVEFGYDNGNPDNVSYDRREGSYMMPWDQYCTFLAIAKDRNGIYGHCITQTVVCTKSGASPAEEFIGR